MNKRIAKKRAAHSAKDLERYERSITRHGSIHSNLNKGSVTVTFDAYTQNGELSLFQLHNELIKPLVKKTNMQEILSRNIDKLKHKMTHTVTVKGVDNGGHGITICTYQLHGHHTLREVARHAIETFPHGRKQQGSGKKMAAVDRIKKESRGLSPNWTAPDIWTPTAITITSTLRN